MMNSKQQQNPNDRFGSQPARLIWIGVICLTMLSFGFCSQSFADSGSETCPGLLISQLGSYGGIGLAIRTLLMLAVLLLFPLKSLVAAIYYVRKTGNNSNSGTTPAAAWATFAKATSSTVAGDIVYFGAGTYTEDVSPTVSGASGSPIRFIADKGGAKTGDSGSVYLVSTGGKGARAIDLNGNNYLQFEGFKITGSGKEGIKAKDSTGITISRCEIYDSSDGIKVDSGASATITNCLIRANSKAGIESKSTAIIWNSTIAGNGDSGVQATDANSAITITNSILVNNTGYGLLRSNGSLTHSYNLLNGNSSGPYSGTTAGTGEITSAPQFTSGSDFHLQKTSPAINAGTSASGTVDDDLDGLFRPISGAWEMGCYEYCPVGPLLMVVPDATTLSAAVKTKLLLIQSWGYCVNVIDDDATQSAFNTAVGSNLAAYVSQEVVATSVGTKLVSAKIGVVNEDSELTDEFGFSSSRTVSSQLGLDVTNNTHYITNTLALGNNDIFSSSQSAVSLSGTISTEAQVVAKWGSANALSLLQSGAKRYDSGTVSGRRVQLPWGGDSFDVSSLNSAGQTIMKRAIQWAHGLAGYWTLDETTGTTAYDSSGRGNNGTLINGITFTTDSVSPAKLGNGLNFDGSNDYISVTSNSTLQPTDAFSISAWIKGDVWSSGSSLNSILRKGTTDPTNYQLAIADGKLSLFLDASDLGGVRGATTLSPGTWYHVVGTWDGITAKVFVNGNLDNSPGTTYLAPIGSDTRALLIGGTGTSDSFDGVIDDVRFYNYALDATEVTSIKGMGQPKGVRVKIWKEIK